MAPLRWRQELNKSEPPWREPEYKGSETTAVEQFSHSDNQDPNQNERLTIQEGSTARAQRSGGPKTRQGKENSKHNALKHGILSKVIVLKGESRPEFNSLLNGLRNDLEPEGTLEELLVDKLAATIWRLRRLMIVDGQKTQKGPEFLQFSDFGLVPNPIDLLRYESNLERTFDRTLIQLERLQRIRKGQPVPPILNVSVST